MGALSTFSKRLSELFFYGKLLLYTWDGESNGEMHVKRLPMHCLQAVSCIYSTLVCVFCRCDGFPVSPGGTQAEGAGEERPVGPGEWQDTEADAGLAGQHRPPPHRIPGWPHRCPAVTTGGSGTQQIVPGFCSHTLGAEVASPPVIRVKHTMNCYSAWETLR